MGLVINPQIYFWVHDDTIIDLAITLFLFYKNHAFQNEARLFLIFFQNRGPIVLNLFLNLIKSLNKKQTKNVQNISTIIFSFLRKGLYSSRLHSFIFLFSFSFFTFSFTFLLFFLSQI